MLDAFHQAHVGFADRFDQILDLAGADAVFAGNQSAQCGSFCVDQFEELVNAGLEFVLSQVVGALIDVQIAIACMAEALDGQAALFADRMQSC